MADIVDSLFGPTPYQIQQQQNANLGVAADKFAAQDPFARAAGQLYRGGGMLAGAAARGMGYVNPMEEQAKLRESVMATGGDMSTSAGLKAKAAQFAQAGDQQTAMKLIMLARKQEAEEADMKLKAAHTKYYEQGGAGGRGGASQLATKQAVARNDLTKVGFQMGLSGQALLDFVEEGVNRLTETWSATTGASTQVPQQSEVPLSATTSVSQGLQITEGQKAAMMQDALSRGDTVAAEKIKNLQASADAPTQSKAQVAGAVKLAETTAAKDPILAAKEAAAKETGKSGAEMNVKQYETALASKSAIQDIQRLEDHLKTSKAITGMGADVFKGIERMKTLLGDKAASGKVSDTEILDVMMGAEVFPLIKSLGIGARGMDTQAERDFMRKVLTGEISLNKDTLLEMARLRRIAAERSIRMWDDRVESGEVDDFYKQTGRKKEKIGASSQPVTAAKRIRFDAKGNMVQ
jgi:hypothetical protein